MVHDGRDKEKRDALSYNGIENSVNIANGHMASRRYEPLIALLSLHCWLAGAGQPLAPICWFAAGLSMPGAL